MLLNDDRLTNAQCTMLVYFSFCVAIGFVGLANKIYYPYTVLKKCIYTINNYADDIQLMVALSLT